MKTPEEMAEEYLEQEEVAISAINHAAEDLIKAAFFAGYEAAMRSTEWQLRILNNLDELIKDENENT